MGVSRKASGAHLSSCVVLTWNLDPLLQLVLDNRAHSWGPEASSNQVVFLWWKKKSKTALLVWCETWREVTQKPRGPGWGLANRAQQDKGKRYSSKAQFCVPLVGRRQCYPVGVGRRQSPLNPHDPADREHRHWPWSPRRRCPGAGLGLGLVSSSAGHLTLEASQFGFHVFSELRESFSHHAVSRDKEPGWFLQDVSQCFGTAAVPRSK